MLLSTLPHRPQSGVSLIESLVAIVVMALGILGILGVQMRTLADTQTGVRRAQAIRLIEDLSERMKVHPNALGSINSYVIGWRTGAPPTAQASKLCVTSTACTHAEFAAYDLLEWKRAVERALPLGDANVFIAPGEPTAGSQRQLGVLIRWRENERDTTTAYKNDLDTASTGLGGGTGVPACNVNATSVPQYTCHLQYIPVSSRCAPHPPGVAVGPTTLYYCPGPRS